MSKMIVDSSKRERKKKKTNQGDSPLTRYTSKIRRQKKKPRGQGRHRK